MMEGPQFKLSTKPLSASSYDDLVCFLNNLPDGLKAITCDHLLLVAKDFLKSQSTNNISTTVISQINLHSEHEEEPMEEEYHETVSELVSNESLEVESVNKLESHCNQAVDITSPERISVSTDQTLNNPKASEDNEVNNDVQTHLILDDAFSKDELLKDELAKVKSDQDSPPEADKNMEEDFSNEKLKAFHERIGYYSFLQIEKPATNSGDNRSPTETSNEHPSLNAKSPEKPQVEPTEKKPEPVVPETNSPPTSVDGHKPVKLIAKLACDPFKPKTSVVIQSIDFKTDSIFASPEFSNFFCDLNISFTETPPTSTL